LEAPAIPGKLSTVPKLQMDVTPQSTAPISQKPKSSNSTEGYATPKGVIRATQPMTKKPASRTQR
jgi:hypothetical protein